MRKSVLKYILVLLAIATVGCAKRGTITGGTKDTLAPVLLNSFPKNFTTDFKAKEIKLTFNEYVKLKNANKQLIISPPLKRLPEILPYTASKVVTIKINDTLLENTTYSMNFGNSIEDNNEGNALQQFKYVFSTGSYIDSLKLNVQMKDALEKKSDNFVSIMLYEVNDKYTDSVIYKEAPRYITNTLDSLNIVKLENLKAGKYKLIALKDVNGNNKYDPKTDKIGFMKEYVSVPNDTLYQVELFKEELPFKAINVSQVSGSKMSLGYEGNPKDVKIAVRKGVENIPYAISKLDKKDSINIWFKGIKGDSLAIDVSKNKFNKTFSLTLKDQKRDSLNIASKQKSILPFRERYTLTSVTPIATTDVTKMRLINKDSTDVKFTTEYDSFNKELYFDFEKQPLEKYTLSVLPGGITDFYDKVNDSLSFKFTTGNTSDYANVRIKLANVKRFPIILELTTDDGKVIATAYSEKETEINFDLIEPKSSTLRVIYDDNKNRIWDAGNFLEQRQSEEVIYLGEKIIVNPNWDVEQSFDLGGK